MKVLRADSEEVNIVGQMKLFRDSLCMIHLLLDKWVKWTLSIYKV